MKPFTPLQGLFACLVSVLMFAATAASQEMIVFDGPEDAAQWLIDENWWGEVHGGEQLAAPRAIITGINPRWQKLADELTVTEKKEIFYRFFLPLALHANEMVADRRNKLEAGREKIRSGESLDETELQSLRHGAIVLRVLSPEEADNLPASGDPPLEVIDELLYRLDVIPSGLVLGQAAYESGYGTSRFAVEGNALFGQWTYGGTGIKPAQQREHLGDHRIASFDWPFDSVRGYFINLSSHPAYEGFRRLRAELRAAGQPLTSLALADGLVRYSERGQEYVDTLKGIIRVNKLDIADDAYFRDEPLRLLIGADGPESARKMRSDLESMRNSGEFAELFQRMRLY
jgi:Bax protein